MSSLLEAQEKRIIIDQIETDKEKNPAETEKSYFANSQRKKKKKVEMKIEFYQKEWVLNRPLK